MKTIDPAATYENRAQLRGDCVQTEDCTDYECCPEELVFAMRDKTHTFSLGLTTVLECLDIAVREGYLPQLPDEWWIDVRRY
ncbi:MAG: hypothetical protein LBS19_04335 [Clostridiales bacterium]|nr:hypothetical protein [Clostridiales bacterium]